MSSPIKHSHHIFYATYVPRTYVLIKSSVLHKHPISSWDVSSVTIMEYMFYSASDFNQPIANWNTSSVADMTGMFGDAESFNQQINAWDTSSATNMSSMFVNAFSFNSFLGHWDVSNVTNMNNMFAFATSFNQELEEYWDVNKVTDCGGFSSQSKMKTKPKFTKCNPN
jgi:surface protein